MISNTTVHAFIGLVGIQVFWFSLFIIGFGILRFVQVRTGRFLVAGFGVGLTLIAAFAASVFAMACVAIPMYVLRSPAAVFTATYLLLLVASVIYLAYTTAPQVWRFLSAKKSVSLKPIRLVWPIVLGSILLAVLVGDYLLSLYIGSQFAEGSDTYVHVAKMVTLLYSGFSIDDGFMAGVAESRYHVSIVHALYVIPCQLFDLAPFQVWRWSLAFFRFMQWLAMFGFIELVLRYVFKKTTATALKSAAVLTLGAMAFLTSSNFMHVADYPNKVVMLWITLFVAALLVREYRAGKGTAVVLLATSLLITFTHPTYALMTALFYMLFTFVKIIVTLRVSKGALILAASVVAVLMLSPLITVFFPDRMTDNSFNFGGFQTVHLLGADVLKPFVPTRPLDLLINVLALLGYAALLYRVRKQRTVVALVASLLIFYALTAFNPVFMSVVQERLPLWLVARFNAMNLLAPLGFLIGLFVIYDYLKVKLPPGRTKAALLTGLFILTGCWGLWAADHSYNRLYDYTKGIDHGYINFAGRTYDDLRNVIPKNSMVVANLGDSYFLPAVIPVKVVAIHEAHATPVAATAERLVCQERLLQQLAPADLRAVKADYVVIPPWDPHFAGMQSILQSHDYFKRVHIGPDYWVYKVDRQHLPVPAQKNKDACVQYQTIEKE